ncbi:MAG: Cupredoxin-like domain [Actinomycetota bacterium]|jgi:plastocyanin|nr:Cupredoxin-like domain [Actinomycetota bacterium]
MKKWSLLLVAAIALTMVACGGDDSGDSGDGGSGGGSVSVVAKDFSFSPSTVDVNAGDSIDFQNDGSTEHNFSIDGQDVDVDAEDGGSATVDVSGLAAGTYDFFCKYHKDQGMTGTLEVK